MGAEKKLIAIWEIRGKTKKTVSLYQNVVCLHQVVSCGVEC